MLQTKNLRIAEFAPLVTPQQLEQQLPATDEIRETVRKSRASIAAMIHGEDKQRLTIVVGPCSTLVARPCDPEALEMVAIEVAVDAQVTWSVRFSVELSDKVPTAENCSDSPKGTLGLTGVTAIEARVGAAVTTNW